MDFIRLEAVLLVVWKPQHTGLAVVAECPVEFSIN
jgi:hypothetical protein